MTPFWKQQVQTIGSAGESVAAGAIFTPPALFMWAKEGCDTLHDHHWPDRPVRRPAGRLDDDPLRSALIVKEHGVLGYPEGQACAEVLIAGEEGGAKASTVFSGLGIAAIYKFVADGLKIFPSEITYDIPAYRGSGVGIDVLPARVGCGLHLRTQGVLLPVCRRHPGLAGHHALMCCSVARPLCPPSPT